MNERDKELAQSIDPDAWRKLHKDDEDWCQRFAELIRADEREACAKLCDEEYFAFAAANEVRARGNK